MIATVHKLFFLNLNFNLMNFKSKITRLFTFSILALAMGACNKDNTSSDTQGTVNFEVTDAPFDDANVQGVFVTVTAIKVDGKEITNFNGKTTFDIAAYQKGETKMVGSTKLDAGTYSNVTLVLDNAKDQSGNAPGSYILTKTGDKKAIASASSETAVTGQFKVLANQTSSAVIDFDLRKSIVYDGTSGYKFVSSSEMSNSVRIVQKSETGVIEGTATNSSVTSSDKIIVYAYKKGTFTKATEMQGQGASSVEFKNAVTSSVVANGAYKLNFLEAGDYELHFVSYKDKNSDGKLDIQGEFQASVLGGLNLSALNVTTSNTVTANINLALIIPL